MCLLLRNLQDIPLSTFHPRWSSHERPGKMRARLSMVWTIDSYIGVFFFKCIFFGRYHADKINFHMGVSKNRGTPKWMVYNGKPLLKCMIWGYHFFGETPICCQQRDKKTERFRYLTSTAPSSTHKLPAESQVGVQVLLCLVTTSPSCQRQPYPCDSNLPQTYAQQRETCEKKIW